VPADLPQMALSLRQPWCVFMLSLPPEHLKRIENRDWGTTFRGDLWVHASKSLTKREFYEACEFALRAGVPREQLPSFDGLPRGGIVGRWRVVDLILPGGKRRAGRELVPHPFGHDRWYMGEFGMVVEDPRAVPFVECKGALGFWRVPADVLAKLAGAT
jgi:hypothetical protein